MAGDCAEDVYCVYVHTFPNGKHYVGQCKEPAKNRWKNGRGYIGQKQLHSAIKKYGWSNIKHEIIHTGLSRKSACQKEIQTITKLNCNSLKGGHGYNMTDGGETGLSGKDNGFFGKKHSSETRARMSKSANRRWLSEEERDKYRRNCAGRESPMRGKHHTEETRKRLSEVNKGINHPQYGKRGSDNPKAKQVRCIETGVEYGCIEDIRDALGVSDVSHISSVCKGKRKTAHGYRWEYIG